MQPWATGGATRRTRSREGGISVRLCCEHSRELQGEWV